MANSNSYWDNTRHAEHLKFIRHPSSKNKNEHADKYLQKKKLRQSSFHSVINPVMHDVEKWSNMLKNLAVFTPQDF